MVFIAVVFVTGTISQYNVVVSVMCVVDHGLKLRQGNIILISGKVNQFNWV